jgi:sugar/nucleoside kinase (ribokinase family)
MDRPWGDAANGWVATLRKARVAGLTTNLELCSIPASRLAAIVCPCLPELDLLIVNDAEIGAISGEGCVAGGRTDVGACVRAARRVLAEGAMSIVVLHFPGGAVAVPRASGVVAKSSVCVPPGAIVGTNGAGDAFAAGFLYGFHEGWGIEQSLALAHAAAAASLRGIGTTDRIENWKRCLELAEAWGWRPPLVVSTTSGTRSIG